VAGDHAYSALYVPSSATGFVMAAIHLSHHNTCGKIYVWQGHKEQNLGQSEQFAIAVVVAFSSYSLGI
jgi:hypothetical protein